MTDLLNLIDEFEPRLKQSFLDAVADTREEVLNLINQSIGENNPIDATQLPQDSNLDILIIDSLDTHLTQGLKDELTALYDDSAILLLSVLGIRDFQQSNHLKAELVKSEIRGITAATSKTVQSVRTNKQRIIETIGLTTKQAASLSNYRLALEKIALPTKPVFRSKLIIGGKVRIENTHNFNDVIPPEVIRTLSASQRSVLRKAINTGIDQQQIEKLVSKQQKALLLHRAKAIARNVSSKLAHTAQQQVFNALATARLIDRNKYRRYWVTAHDEKVRHSHSQVEATHSKGVAINQPFKTALGNFMHPPLEINCRCHVVIKKAR